MFTAGLYFSMGMIALNIIEIFDNNKKLMIFFLSYH